LPLSLPVQRRVGDGLSPATPSPASQSGDGTTAAGGSVAAPPALASPPSRPAVTLPLAVQRSLAPAGSRAFLPVASSPASRGGDGTVATGAAVAALPTWPAPVESAEGSAPPTLQRWPDLGAVTDTGRGALGAARDRARDAAGDLAAPGRGAAGDRLGDAVPSLPDIPGAGALPALDLANPPALPARPSLPDLTDVPGAAGLPDVPTVSDLVGAPGMPSLPGTGADTGSVPMTQITFPAPAAAPAAAAAAGDLDELAHKLYDRIRWRMRAELRLDRERAGLGAGVRH
jgi:hypothetical protein